MWQFKALSPIELVLAVTELTKKFEKKFKTKFDKIKICGILNPTPQNTASVNGRAAKKTFKKV